MGGRSLARAAPLQPPPLAQAPLPADTDAGQRSNSAAGHGAGPVADAPLLDAGEAGGGATHKVKPLPGRQLAASASAAVAHLVSGRGGHELPCYQLLKQQVAGAGAEEQHGGSGGNDPKAWLRALGCSDAEAESLLQLVVAPASDSVGHPKAV